MVAQHMGKEKKRCYDISAKTKWQIYIVKRGFLNMTPREQWVQFYEHGYDCSKTPHLAGLHIVSSDAAGIPDRVKSMADSGKDWFGVEWVKDGSLSQTVPDPRVDFLLQDIEDWREVVQFPDLDHFDFETAVKNSGLDQVDRTQKLIYFPMVIGPFERLHLLMGFENSLMALISDPEECTAFFDAYMEWRCRLIEKVKEHFNPDVIMFHDDVGTQMDLFFSPETWRTLLKPQLKKAVDKVHELGMYFEYHSCGKIERIVPELVDIGVDAWQGQEINDIQKLKTLTGGKLEYHPILDYQKKITEYRSGKITLEDVRAYTKETILKNLEGGHYAPLVQDFGDEVTKAMLQEFVATMMQCMGAPV